MMTQAPLPTSPARVPHDGNGFANEAILRYHNLHYL